MAIWTCGSENGVVIHGPNGGRFGVGEEEGKLKVGRDCDCSIESSGCGDLIGELRRKERNEIGFVLFCGIDIG